jgi:hypothetical protein
VKRAASADGQWRAVRNHRDIRGCDRFVHRLRHPDGNIAFTAALSADGNDVYLEVTGAAVPEPASLILLRLGALGVGAFVPARRRRAAGDFVTNR